MLEILEAVFLGIVQGLTEFLPISSSGHLLLGQYFLGMDAQEAAVFLAGSVSSAVVGYLAVRFLLRFLVNHSQRVFAYYRFALAAVVALALLPSGS